MERKLLTPDEIAAALGTLNGWTVDGYVLRRRFEFENFAAALTFVNRVGEIAESLDHHPDITFGWGYANISTTTHDRGGITDFDLELARRIDAEAGA
jgi:4a-hydroxytetrahydrobiopterin dehydratase